MAGMIQEFYLAQVIAAATPLKIGTRIHGILSSAIGTITITGSDGVVIVNALPTVAGYNKLAIIVEQSDGMTVTSSAAGTLLT